MGRLIDADKAQKDFITATGKRSLIIDTAETVPAIPVDWLMKKADWCDKNNGIFVSGAIRSAVDAWREEQENASRRG